MTKDEQIEALTHQVEDLRRDKQRLTCAVATTLREKNVMKLRLDAALRSAK